MGMYRLSLKYDGKSAYLRELTDESKELLLKYLPKKLAVTATPLIYSLQQHSVYGFSLCCNEFQVDFYCVPYNCGLLHMAALSGVLTKGVWKALLSSAKGQLGYSAIQYVVANYQEDIIKNLTELGFEELFVFDNERSGNVNRIFAFSIPEEI